MSSILLTILWLCLAVPRLSRAADGPAHLAHLLRVFNTDPVEQNRLDALSQLEKGTAIDSKQITRSICDTSPAIRAAMIRLGTSLAAQDPDLESKLLALAHDPQPKVQMQLLKSLPAFSSPKAAEIHRKLLHKGLQSSDKALRSLAESLSQTAQNEPPVQPIPSSSKR